VSTVRLSGAIEVRQVAEPAGIVHPTHVDGNGMVRRSTTHEAGSATRPCPMPLIRIIIPPLP
jgi:hypothetical protein